MGSNFSMSADMPVSSQNIRRRNHNLHRYLSVIDHYRIQYGMAFPSMEEDN
jgi:hypothetical protein